MTKKVILIGSVGSSELVLEEMINNEFLPSFVFGLDEKYSSKVSSFVSLSKKAKFYNIPYKNFRNINDIENIEIIASLKPDYIFVIGVSQLVKSELINLAREGVIGYHPTALPKYRGRAALPWQILLGVEHAKCSLFYIDEGMDSGDIIGQKDYYIKANDYVGDVIKSSRNALRTLLKEVLPELKYGVVHGSPQNEKKASYLLKRTSEDGKINWNDPIESIHRLIRASSHPFPGAYSEYEGKDKIIFWSAEMKENSKYIGKPGQIAHISDNYLDILCVDGILRVQELENTNLISFKLGDKFI